jgi:hypothetical protein
MNAKDHQMIAPCGLNCQDCAIRKAPFDSNAADEVVSWFQSMGWLKGNEGLPEILEREMYCKGCHGNRSLHWAPECWILACCVDQHGLTHCSKCGEFPCDRLESWSEQNDRYTEALNKLRSMTVRQSSSNQIT